jgi:hypothetical protein
MDEQTKAKIRDVLERSLITPEFKDGECRQLWYVSTTLAQLGLEFREENARFMGWDQRLLYDSQVLGRVKGRFALRP